MTQDDWSQVSAKYKAAFGTLLPTSIPMGYTEDEITEAELLRLARLAIERGKPINWDDHYDRLPPGMLS
jgi:alanine-alpha-ketoisovalerate/valine-pyruvate aminotransferase